ncbi:hypothetical protein BP422_25740 [Brevibacillus formosus]|uniref:Uncharacterized protein n=1 Tax=Brevibacillus formosus TaxID=54913 RepID=A0A220MNJ6_9BACL|nr:hypothetical protein [Brevibacillus formosus]ASJ56641.1 hypothetical protein BP422_25740 [Brevibacillus formosus]
MSEAGRYGRLFSFRHLDGVREYDGKGRCGAFGRKVRGNLPPIQIILTEVGLQFSGDVSFEMPADVVYSDLYTPRLFFFRALLKKK